MRNLKLFSLLVAVNAEQFLEQRLANARSNKEGGRHRGRPGGRGAVQTGRPDRAEEGRKAVQTQRQQPLPALLLARAVRRELSEGDEDQASVVPLVSPQTDVGRRPRQVRRLRGPQLQNQRRLSRPSGMAERNLLQVPAVGHHAEPADLPARRQRDVREQEHRRWLPQLLARHRPPAHRIPLRHLRGHDRRSSGHPRSHRGDLRAAPREHKERNQIAGRRAGRRGAGDGIAAGTEKGRLDLHRFAGDDARESETRAQHRHIAAHRQGVHPRRTLPELAPERLPLSLERLFRFEVRLGVRNR